MRAYYSIEEIRDHNNRIGGFFFKNERYFKSRYHYRVFRNTYFISMEKFPDGTRPKTLRMAVDGDIVTVFGFGAFSSISQVERAINELPLRFPEAYELASHVFNTHKPKEIVTGLLTQSGPLCDAMRYLCENHQRLGMSFVAYYCSE